MTIYKLGDIAPEMPEGDAFWVAPDAALIGRVVLCREASVWFGAVLRGDNEPITVGEGSNVQDLCVIHTDPGFPCTVGRDCTIGHRAILHGCEIGDNTLIGMGATVLNGAVVGRNCLVGAGALVPEGREIPDNSLVVGMPAKVVRALDDGAVNGLTASAQRYADKWKRFAKGLEEA